ncbi:7TM diverse intracellular signalling [Pseudobacteriovorax antillogorgiicola]|uniref:7TM diverse intracellular signalling n=1 Tax=Pseudobacteriovorax antillogorgiicola TaxID=1513793 RepID=A0A1Y6CAL7_9BACT|nr:7TM protein involved in diverse intracellular signaling [Pseudobacteriovorax antillogorgiicola]SMF54514.1 7TM diverse intracellular signalling [Pseudobacteriovorax antillogorgiicola]
MIQNMIFIMSLATCLSEKVRGEAILLDQAEQVYVGNRGVYLFDETGTLAIEDIVGIQDFEVPPNPMANYGIKAGVSWGKFVFENSSQVSEKRILNYRFPVTDRVTLYVPNQLGSYKEISQGDQVSFLEYRRDYRSPYFIVDFPPGLTEVYLRIESTDILKWPLFLWSEARFHEFKIREYFLIATTLGIIIFVVIASLIFYFTLRDRTFLHIALYNIFFINFELSYLGLLDQLFSFHPAWLKYINQWLIVNGLLTCIFVTNFTVRFLKFWSYSKAFFWTARLFVGMMTVFILVSLIAGYGAGAVLLLLSNGMMLTVIIGGGLISIQKGYQPARLYFLAWSFMVFGNLAMMANLWGLFPLITSLELGVIFGVILKESLLCWVLGKLKFSQDRKIRDDSIKSKQIRESLAVARKIQESLIPSIKPIKGLNFHTFYQPAQSIGGDWYGVYNFPEKNVSLILVGDVTGHGIPSALMSGSVASVASAVIEPMMIESQSPKTFLKDLFMTLNHTVMERDVGEHQLMTMVGLLIDLSHRVIYYINAGHTGVILKTGDTMKSLLVGGTPLGFTLEPELGETSYQYNDDTIVLVYSDGLIENEDVEIRPLRIREVSKMMKISATADQAYQKISSRYKMQYESAQQQDDCTILVMDIAS